MRLVLDCNVIIAAGLIAGTSRRVVEAAVREHTLIVCDEIISEYRAVASTPHARRNFGRRRCARRRCWRSAPAVPIVRHSMP